MKLAIMQPYFLPYIGYWQLLNAVDNFVIYDNIQYTKKGWINKNKFLQNGKSTNFSIALKKDSDYLDICKRKISQDFDKKKLLNQIKEAYRKAPHFNKVFSLFENIVMNEESNLFEYILYSVKKISEYLNISTNLIISSTVDIDHSLKSQEKVLEICKKLKADTYINAIGGQELYSKVAFLKNGITLKFLKSHNIEYVQFYNAFVPWLSILDIMMFNDLETINIYLNKYEVV